MKIDMTEVHNQKTALSNSQTSITTQLETAKTSFVNLVNSESLKEMSREQLMPRLVIIRFPY